MAHSYASTYPTDTSVDPGIVKFFELFYQISDTPGDHDRYVDQFAPDATFKLASKKAVGKDEILTLRQGMWSAVESRKHTIPSVFPFGSNAGEFMLHGTVLYKLKTGTEAEVEWAARANVIKSPSDGKYRFAYYQVYLDTGAMAASNKK